ncbi:DUF4097 family beta strand repeat-containing protein [Actinoplanes sp. NPDC051470]|uniref:DUF4097 family beta strand repeat-containing protein n=1 Tax=Actinoplanes sp. NPDC051470 TaxID=3157224 RepID=UPI003417A5E1
MPDFDTTGPIEATINVVAGNVRVTAGDTPGTTVEVRPANPGSDRDQTFAEQTVVEYANGRLLVKGPKQKNFGIFGGKAGVVDVEITLATGSGIDADGGILNLTSRGALGDCRVKAGVGDVRLERVASVDARTGAGALTVLTVDGDATAVSGSGEVRVGEVGKNAQLKTGNGETRLESVGGDLRARSSNGSVMVGRAGGNVDAATANGSIRIDEIAGGTVSLKTALGELEVGVPEGLPAYLDLHTSFGTVHNRLTASDAPGGGQRHAEVRAHTSYGDVIVRRKR